MTTVKLHVDPDQTPAEEARLVARVAAAVAEQTGSDTVAFELVKSEQLAVQGSVADRMQGSDRWSR
jgi:phenylpyruvate tautomerase PptA (4-oxalocrotonate tautomerase family)